MKFGRNSLLLLAAAVGLPAVDAHCGGTPPERRTLQRRSASLGKRAECGPGVGSCPPGQCCSDAGNCGTDEDYCDGASCQLDYSDSCDTFHSPPGASTANIARPKIGSVPYGTVITSCTTPGTVALTFDDGPWIYTSQILDVLDQLGIKATFFIVGNNLGKTEMDSSATSWPAILQRMHNAGHQMASHTWTHRDLELVNTTIQNTEIIYNEMAFRNIFGFFPTYFRAPYLDCESDCLLLLNSFGYHVIDQNIDTKDYENDDPTLIQTSKNTFANALSSKPATHSYIELSHDIHYQTVVNLTQFMYQTSIAKGYKLTTVGECLGDPPANWYRSAGGSGSVSTSTSKTSSKSSSTSQSSTKSTSVSTTKSTSVSTTKSTSVSTSKSTSVSTTKSTSVSSTKTSTSATSTSTLKLSPDQTCGGTTGYTCQGSQWGNCCSFYGWCGSTTDYCGTGCQSAFGTCSSAGTGIGNTTNGLCGSAYGTTCLYYGTKTCCSQFGYCGSTSAYCGTGCQTKYGKCT